MGSFWYIFGFFFVGMPTGYFFRENQIPPPLTVNTDAIGKAVRKLTGQADDK